MKLFVPCSPMLPQPHPHPHPEPHPHPHPEPHPHANPRPRLRCGGRLSIVAALALAAMPVMAQQSTRELGLTGNRFSPLEWEALDDDQRAFLEGVLEGPRNSLGGPFNVLLRAPELGELSQKLGAYARFDSSLPATLRELAIIMTARHWSAEFEWYAHKRAALAAGVDPAIVESIRTNERPAGMSADEAAVHDFVAVLLRDHRVPDDVFTEAVSVLGERGVVDVIGTIGYYSIVSMLLNADEYPLPEGVDPELD